MYLRTLILGSKFVKMPFCSRFYKKGKNKQENDQSFSNQGNQECLYLKKQSKRAFYFLPKDFSRNLQAKIGIYMNDNSGETVNPLAEQ